MMRIIPKEYSSIKKQDFFIKSKMRSSFNYLKYSYNVQIDFNAFDLNTFE